MHVPTSLLTDRHELAMVDVALADGTAHRRSVFELFPHSLPPGRSYGIVGGTSRALDAVSRFRFTDDELQWLSDNQVVSRTCLDFLAGYRFSGDIWGFLEGECFLANSPVLTVEAPFAEALLLESVLLSIYNHDSAVASAMTRMVDAAGDRPIIEGGSRQTHELAAVAAARAAYLAGAAATSNLAAGRRYGLPTAGTMAHVFLLAHSDERAAFSAQLRSLGPDTAYPVDTYDTAQGIRNAVAVAGTGLRAIRIDSGDLALEAKRARALLDELGATHTRIIASGDLDEWSIFDLAAAPIDSYLVGTRAATGSGHPTASMVYQLVAVENRAGELTSVARTSTGRPTIGGRKAAFRVLDDGGLLLNDLLVTSNDVAIEDRAARGRRLQIRLVDQGQVTGQPSLTASRSWCTSSRAELPADGRAPDSEMQFETTVV
jgi:nicotinate phosphoribosyltransferase